ncbi:ESPR-type extended signal peptide-containing protein [Mitsuokella jalaludinii]|uniref:ESPR-type extended signal peptide-containing protein n=1 Tax=Mitsuokella jalaludinii TaxID=187979 RepID=UPI003F8BEE0D
MNKIYKVIWSKARQCYIVASELAHRSGKKSAAVLAVAACTMPLFSHPAFAADASSAAPTYIDITINHVAESTGIEMGDGARARGTGSIATGRNSVAVGKNAVATGGNENKDTITQKLNENKEKLAEIETAQNNVNTLTDDLQTIRAKYADVIEAGTRVKQVQEAKEKARLSWQDKLSAYNTAVDGSKQYLADAQAKIDDLNSRLNGVSKLGSVDISSEQGLTTAATQLKSIVEKDTTLNLSQDFYKDYVKSYYQALGDLRQNQIISSNTDYNRYTDSCPGSNDEKNVINPYCQLNDMRPDGYDNTPWDLHLGDGNGYSAFSIYAFLKDSSITDTPTKALEYINIDTATTTLADYQEAQSNAAKYKAGFQTYFAHCNDAFLTDEIRTALLNQLDAQADLRLKTYEITYYQGQYEATKNTTWLDKKKKALDELNNMKAAYWNLPRADILRKDAIDAWRKANITDIQDKNKVTTDTLTGELEKALNISKDAITKKQKELADLKATADQAEKNYEAINPDQKDLYLSAQYDTVMKQLTDKANELKASQNKLDALKAALTLNDLTNTGENAYAIGTDALATGTNAYAIGTSAVATGESSLAVGNGAIVTAKDSIGIGTGSAVLGERSGSVGAGSTVYGAGSYAIGSDNTVGATDSTTKKPLTDKGNGTFVLGSNITTTANNAVILGAGSTDGGDNTVSFGSDANQRRLTHVAAGTSDTDAAILGQVLAYDDMSKKDVVTMKGSKGTRLTNLKDATLSAASTDAVTGRQLYATNQNIAGFAADIKSNTNTISDLAKSVTNTLDSVSAMSESFSSINSLKADASLNNLSDAGKQVISDAAKEAVQNYVKGLNSTSAATSNILMTSNVAAVPTLKSRMALSTSLLAVPADMSNSDQSDAATKDLDNLTDTGKQAIRDVMQSDLDQKADKTAVDEALSKKADKAEMDAALAKKADQSAVDEALSKKADKASVDEALTKKADADASNIDVAAFTKKLGTGSVAEGSANLVTGDTVFKAIQKTDAGLVKSDGKVMTLGRSDTAAVIDVNGANGARAITGVATNPMDVTSAANVGYVNASAQGLHNEIQGVQQSLTDDIKKVGAGAAALAGLHPQDYDPEDKWDFAVGYGNYRGQNASAVAAYYHPNEDTLINVGSTLGNGNNMVTAGVSFKFGPGGGTHTMSRTALTQQVSTLREQNQRMGQGMNLLASENDALRKENQSLRSDMDAMKAQMQKMAERLEKLEQ